jgi:hypothetical protein
VFHNTSISVYVVCVLFAFAPYTLGIKLVVLRTRGQSRLRDVSLSVFPSVCPSVHPSVCLSVGRSVCPSDIESRLGDWGTLKRVESKSNQWSSNVLIGYSRPIINPSVFGLGRIKQEWYIRSSKTGTPLAARTGCASYWVESKRP